MAALDYQVISLKTTDKDEQQILDQVDRQYNDICKSVAKTRTLKSTGGVFKIKWEQEQEQDGVAALAREPLSRMKPDSEHEVYSKMNNVVVVCLRQVGSEPEPELVGFLGGVVNVYAIMEQDSAALESYDRMKYNIIYTHLVPKDDAAPPPISWIEVICVHPIGRGIGVARRLMNAFIEHCKTEEKSDDLLLGLDIVGTLNGGINLGLKDIYEYEYDFDFGAAENSVSVPTMFRGAQFAGKRL
jgi:GNAT superfamily N-acetyltransferase